MTFVYILKSLKTGKYYYGSTDNLEKRLKKHNSGSVKSTKASSPWEIHYFEELSSRSEAGKRELFFKSIDGYLWIKSQKIT